MSCYVLLRECDTLSSNDLSQTLTAVCWLIRPVATIVLRVTFPPERNALVILAHKLQQQEGNESIIQCYDRLIY